MDVSGGQAAARQTGLAILATMRADLGSLDKVVRLIKSLGMVNATPEFTDHPKVINGYSDLMKEVFGDAGVGTRARSVWGSSRRNRRGDRGDFPGQGLSCSLGELHSPMGVSRVPRPGRLEGRNCLIVGGTSGIGLASARRFLEEGAHVVVAGRAAGSRSCRARSTRLAWPLLELDDRARSGPRRSRSAVRRGADSAGGPSGYSAARRRNQRSQVWRWCSARVFRRRLGARHAGQRLWTVPHQSRRRAHHALSGS